MDPAIVASLIGATAALAVGLLGYRQWRSGQKMAAGSEYRAERVASYQALWDAVQAAHIEVRVSDDYRRYLRDTYRELNLLLIRRAPFLESEDMALAHRFLASLDRFRQLLDEVGTADEKIHVLDTAAEPFTGTTVTELSDAYGEVVARNEALKRRYQRVLTER